MVRVFHDRDAVPHLALAAGSILLASAAAAAAAIVWRRHVRARARAEEQRRCEARARELDLLSEHANDTVLLVDGEGRIVRANDRVREYYGWTSDELVGQTLRFLRDAGHAHAVAEQIRRIRSEGRLRYETVHRRRDGTTFPVEVSARGFEAHGQWLFQAIVRDASERRAALRAASYQAELLRNLYDAVIGLDEACVIRSWNPAAERIYGVAAADAIGHVIGALLPSEYEHYTFPEFLAALNREGRLDFKVRRRTPRGHWVDLEGSAVVLRDDDGRVTGYVTVNRDVTLRNRAEAALRRSQERLARILETSSEGVWIVDAEGRTEFMNARAARHLGVAPEDAVGRPVLDVVSDAGRAAAEADLAAVLRGESVRRELALPRPDGSLWLHASWTALRDDDGAVAGGVALLLDVTEQRRAREQLLQAQKMDAVGRLASGIAHDFNNLLVSVLTCSGFLLESLPEGDPRREDAAEIRDAGERAAGLVRQLLAFGRKSTLRAVAVDPNAVVRGIDGILRRALGEPVELALSLAPDLWHARIDPGQLEQVVINLALNARDAMPQGGALSIATGNVELAGPSLDSAALTAGRYARLTVTDTGCGIAADVLPMIFEPFFTTKEKGRGTGLGLSTVYGIVKEAGGAVTVRSEPGRGTTFSVWLPACAAAEEVAPPPAPAPVRGRGERILVVEDQDSVRRVTRRILEEHGFRVVDVDRAAAALRAVEEDGPFELVLSDVVMPHGSGTALAASLRTLRPELPVVLMSGYAEWQSRPGAAANVLQKPFTVDALLARVHGALRA